MHYIPFPKTTPTPDWPPTVQISSSNGRGPLHTHSIHKMLHFELLSAAIEDIATEILPPQHTPSPSLVFIYYFQTAHKEEAAIFEFKHNHTARWSIWYRHNDPSLPQNIGGHQTMEITILRAHKVTVHISGAILRVQTLKRNHVRLRNKYGGSRLKIQCKSREWTAKIPATSPWSSV